MDTQILNRITINPEVCNGNPTVRGMRITVDTVLEYLSAGDTFENILKSYPFLEYADIQACIAFALKNLHAKKDEILLAS